MVGAHRKDAPACTEVLWSEQETINGQSTQKWCSCICRSTVVGAEHIKWLEHTGQCSCICRSCVVGPGYIKWSEHTGMMLLHIYRSSVVGAGGRRHTGQCPCMCRGTVVGPGDIELSEHTGQCTCMCRSTEVGPGGIKWSEHTGMVLLHMQKKWSEQE
jgi:hypothetical protein